MQLSIQKIAATRYTVTLTRDNNENVTSKPGEITAPEAVSNKGLARRARKWANAQGVPDGTCLPVTVLEK